MFRLFRLLLRSRYRQRRRIERRLVLADGETGPTATRLLATKKSRVSIVTVVCSCAIFLVLVMVNVLVSV